MPEAVAPADMTRAQLDAALRRCVTERAKASEQRRKILLTVADTVLDEVLVRRGVG